MFSHQVVSSPLGRTASHVAVSKGDMESLLNIILHHTYVAVLSTGVHLRHAQQSEGT
jgi:hypothetical protein